MELPEQKTSGKMELMQVYSDLMPAGKPKYLEVIKYPMIKNLIEEHGRPKMHKVLFLMIKDFCNSVNVVRNMNEDQMIEAAAMLLDECDNFRLEDYTMMFALGKRGELVKIMDRLDISVITQMLDKYWEKRQTAATSHELDEDKRLNSIGPVLRQVESANPMDQKLMRSADGLAGAIGDLKTRFAEWKENE